ncbi:putative leucine-rich repeat-containing protein DDB_G0290503 [Sebastes umbrosus]|uniref:putative leucine-rich repeat-containing protein DDB_G0290503 n=1 Tax=Sebastes umbrosus TaxID=72105 RepID=UPI00189E3525|nr:putative leucine-rich repeat-containing protein DDB_G0290503 [Sebastes umbrosus]
MHRAKLAPLRSLHQGKPAPLPNLHEGELAPLPSLHQGKPGPLPSLHEGKLAPLPSLHQGKLAPLPPVHQGKLAPLPSLHQDKLAPLPTVHQDKLAPLPPVHQGKLAPLPPVHQGKLAPLPPVHQGKLAPLPSVHQGKPAPLPSLHQVKPAPLPPVHQDKLAPLPTVHQDKLAPLPPVHQDKLAPLPPVHQGKLAPLPPVHQGKLAPLPSLHQGKPAPLPSLHQGKPAPLPPVHQSKLAPLPPVHQGKLAPLPSLHQGKPAPLPTVHQDKLAPLPTVHQGKLAPRPPSNQGRPAPLPTVHQEKLAPLPSLHQGKPALSEKLKETTSQLQLKGDELLDSETVWQEKFKALKDRSAKKLAKKEQAWKTLQLELQKKVDQVQDELHRRDNEIEGLSQKLKETSQLQLKGGELLDSETVWQEKFKALEDRSAKDLAEKEQAWKTLQLELQKTVDQVQDELHRRGDRIEGLSQKLRETTSQLQLKGGELLDSETVWQDKFKALEDRSAKDLAKKEQAQKTLQLELQKKVDQVQDELHRRDDEIEGLSQKLKETTSQLSLKGGELLDSKTVWQEKFKALEDRSAKDLAEKEQAQKTLQLELQKKVDQVKDELHRRDNEVEGLSQKIKETSQLQLKGDELLDSETVWQEKFKALKDRSAKKLAKKEQAWKTLQLELQKKVDQVQDELHRRDNEVEGLSQKLKETTSQLQLKGGELLDSETVWQEKFKALKDRSAKKLAKKEQAWKTLQLELQKKVDQVKDELHRRDNEVEGLSQKIKETSQLQLKGDELLDSETVWQEKFKALKDRSAKKLAKKEQAWKTLQLELQKKVDQVQDELHRRDNEIEGLSQKLKETSQLQLKGGELLDSETVWQEKFKALEDRSAKDLAEKEQAWKTLQLELQKTVDQVQDELHRRGDRIEGLSQKLRETTSQLQLKGGELLDSETVWQDKFKALEDRSAKDLAKKEQAQKTLQLELQKKVDQVQDELHRRDDEIEGLSQKLKETTSQLSLKGGELLDSKTVWQEKFKALEDRSAKDLAEKEQAQKTLQLELQKKVDQVKDELHRRDNEVEGLSQKIKETSQLQLKGGELLDSETVWQEKFKALKDRSAKKLAKKEQAWKTLQLELQKKVDQVQDELHRRDNEVEGLSQKLKETTSQLQLKGGELLDSETVWQEKFKALKDRSAKKLAKKEQAWKTLQLELQKKVDQVQDELSKTVCKNAQTLANNQQLEKQLQKVQEENKDLAEKVQRMHTRVRQMEVDLANKQHRWETKIKQLEKDNEDLEELCLNLNKKRGFFSRKRDTEDRQEELQKLKSKMHDKKMKKKEKEKAQMKPTDEKVEINLEEQTEKRMKSFLSRQCDGENQVEEAAGCSAQAPPPFSSPTSLQPHLPPSSTSPDDFIIYHPPPHSLLPAWLIPVLRFPFTKSTSSSRKYKK